LAPIQTVKCVGILTDHFFYSRNGCRRPSAQVPAVPGLVGSAAASDVLARLLRKQSCERSTPWSPPPPSPSSDSSSSPSWTASR